MNGTNKPDKKREIAPDLGRFLSMEFSLARRLRVWDLLGAALLALVGLGDGRGSVFAQDGESTSTKTANAAADFTATPAVSTGCLVVDLDHFRNSEGRALAILFDVPEDFPAKPDKAFRRAAAPIVDGLSTITLSAVPFGEYALSIVHDENMNDKMDYRIGLMPREGYGFSNNLNPRFGPPKFREAAIDHQSTQTLVRVSVRYYGR